VDGKRISLEVALKQVIGQGYGTLLSCVPGALGYFEGEEPKVVNGILDKLGHEERPQEFARQGSGGA